MVVPDENIYLAEGDARNISHRVVNSRSLHITRKTQSMRRRSQHWDYLWTQWWSYLAGKTATTTQERVCYLHAKLAVSNVTSTFSLSARLSTLSLANDPGPKRKKRLSMHQFLRGSQTVSQSVSPGRRADARQTRKGRHSLQRFLCLSSFNFLFSCRRRSRCQKVVIHL